MSSVAIGLNVSFGGGMATSPSLLGRVVLPLAQYRSGARHSLLFHEKRQTL